MPLTFSEHFRCDVQTFQDESEMAKRTVIEAEGRGELGFTKLPFADVSAIEELAQEIANEFHDVVVIGIGGSDLGTRAVFHALKGSIYNLKEEVRAGAPRLFFAGDTTDPVALQEIIDVVDWQSAALVMVSKSGNTVEQMSVFIYLRNLLLEKVGDEQTKRAIITVTDATTGTLRQITDQEGYRSVAIPSDVGGRFSVLASPGLLPLAIVGVDIRSLLKGAADLRVDDERPAHYALIQYAAYRRTQRIHVIMPYTYNLREVGFWFRQLWAESLGKAKNLEGSEVHVSPTPIASLGPTDQHSQGQLYREGANDKTYTFVTVREPRVNMTIPAAFPRVEGVQYLAGHNFNEILLAEQQSTEVALQEVDRPTCCIVLDRLDEYHLGQLLFFFELATAYAGALFGINTYDQPGVERGKELMYEILGK